MPQINMMFIGMIVLFLALTTIDAQYMCKDRSVNCINVRNCPQILSILTDPRPLSEQALEFIRNSQCGFEGNDLKVCCNESQSSGKYCRVDGQVGACILARDCALVANILQQSREQAVAYLKRNHCGFEGSNPLVCCIGNANVNTGPGDLVTNPGITQAWINSESTTSPSNEGTRLDLLNNSLLPNKCGRDLSYRIIPGSRIELDEFPWMALLEYQKSNGTSMACGGVLISKRYVLTAAHCIKGKDLPPDWRLISVRLGEYNTDTERDCLPEAIDDLVCADDPVTVGVEEQIVHEKYLPLSRDQRYDIALVRLNRDVTFTDFIQPICLPSSNLSLPQNKFEHVAEFVVVGWGKTETRSASNIKRRLRLSLAENAQCDQTYRNVGVQLGYGQFCVGGQRGKDLCWSDSGGPLMTIADHQVAGHRWTTVGVLSFGPSSCDMQGWPGVYTKVIDFVPWILNKLRP